MKIFDVINVNLLETLVHELSGKHETQDLSHVMFRVDPEIVQPLKRQLEYLGLPVVATTDYGDIVAANKFNTSIDRLHDIIASRLGISDQEVMVTYADIGKKELSELSTNLLGRYKTAAGKSAKAADAAGDVTKGNKRFSGIVQATKKQFANDAKPK